MRFIQRRSPAIDEIPPWPQHAETVRLLLIDDDEDEFELLRGTLAEIRGTRYELEWASTYGEGLHGILELRHHAYLVDVRLGATNGIELVREARAQGSEAPLIMLTGERSRSVDMEAMDAGATDFLEKGRTPPALLERTIRYAITQAATTQTLRRTLRQISGIDALGRTLAQEGPRPEALDEALRLVCEEFGAEAASLYLLERDWLRLTSVRGYEHPLSEIDPRGGRLGRVLESGRGQVVPNLSVDPERRSNDDPMELALPLIAEGTLLGLLAVAWSDAATADDERAMRLVADRLAVALALNRSIRGRSYTEPASA